MNTQEHPETESPALGSVHEIQRTLDCLIRVPDKQPPLGDGDDSTRLVVPAHKMADLERELASFVKRCTELEHKLAATPPQSDPALAAAEGNFNEAARKSAALKQCIQENDCLDDENLKLAQITKALADRLEWAITWIEHPNPTEEIWHSPSEWLALAKEQLAEARSLAPAPAPEGRGETGTPDTDAEWKSLARRCDRGGIHCVHIDFARRLERERDEARAERDKLRDGNHQLDFDLALRRLKNNQLCALINNFEAELTKAREEITVRNEQIMRERAAHAAAVAQAQALRAAVKPFANMATALARSCDGGKAFADYEPDIVALPCGIKLDAENRPYSVSITFGHYTNAAAALAESEAGK